MPKSWLREFLGDALQTDITTAAYQQEMELVAQLIQDNPALVTPEYQYDLLHFANRKDHEEVLQAKNIVQVGINKYEFSLTGFIQKNCIFFHIPRAAGLSVAKAVFNNAGGGHADAEYYRILFGRKFWDYFKFAFVRNPYSRLISIYKHISINSHFSDSIEGKFFTEILNKHENFSSFIKNEIKNFQSFHSKGLNLFAPQVNFFSLDGKIVLDFIGYTENILADIKRIKKYIDLDSEIQHRNALHDVGYINAELEDYYDPESLTLVQDFYQQDFEKLGYSHDIKNLQANANNSISFSSFSNKTLEGLDIAKNKNLNKKEKVTIIIPYRDREEHKNIFIPYVTSFFINKKIDYDIYIIEQTKNKKFNRGKLLNIGFSIATKLSDAVFFIFHDIDMLPIDVDYSPASYPVHLATRVEQFNYRLPYPNYLGGVTAFPKDKFRYINGFSNEYWGWGGEDDDLFLRCKKKGLDIHRRDIGSFISLKHDRPSGTTKDNMYKLHQMRTKEIDFEKDGLSTLSYKVIKRKSTSWYNIVTVEI